MAKGKAESSSGTRKPRRPAISPEARENQLIAKAVDLAERQLDDGTASSQVITHFLKLGTEQARLEREKLRRENLLLEAKADAIKNQERDAEKYEHVLRALRLYSGNGDPDEY